MIQQIASASEQQSVAAGQISKNVESVARVTKESEEGAEQASSTADQLARQAESLRETISQFTLKSN